MEEIYSNYAAQYSQRKINLLHIGRRSVASYLTPGIEHAVEKIDWGLADDFFC